MLYIVSVTKKLIKVYIYNDQYNKKITYMWRRWSTPQNLIMAFIDKLEKQIFKKLLKSANN